MKPNHKSDALEAYLTNLQPTRQTAMAAKKCVVCAGDASTFKDDLSAKEYTISGLCQECQDVAFAPCEEDEEDPCNEQDWRADR